MFIIYNLMSFILIIYYLLLTYVLLKYAQILLLGCL